MKVQVFHLFFNTDRDGAFIPTDAQLHALAVKFAAEYIVTPIDFTTYKETWVACEVDDEGKPVRALGLMGMVLRPDFVVCRFIDNAAVVKLVQRVNDFLHDSYGARGCEVLIYISKQEVPEQQCPNYRDWMKLFGLKEADRMAYTVR
jgi:hypothetical protein